MGINLLKKFSGGNPNLIFQEILFITTYCIIKTITIPFDFILTATKLANMACFKGELLWHVNSRHFPCFLYLTQISGISFEINQCLINQG